MDPFSFLEESGDKKSWIFAIFDYFPVVPDALPRSGVTFYKTGNTRKSGFQHSEICGGPFSLVSFLSAVRLTLRLARRILAPS